MDPLLVEMALGDLESEQHRRVPTQNQKIFEQALADAEARKKRVLSEKARQAARTPRPDALQKLIIERVAENPSLNEAGLLSALDQVKGHGVIDDIDACKVNFCDRGRSKSAPISGLRDRLRRAKARAAR